MKFDPTIYRAIAEGTLTVERVLDEMQEAALQVVADDALAAGGDPLEVWRAIEKLRKKPVPQLETARQMLESGATSVQ